jgi:TonB-linked SusC/RagA family outer membrane protein
MSNCIRKLTMLWMIVALVQMHALAAAQRISLKLNQVSLEKVFKEIHQKSGYDFFYDRSILDKAKPVTVNFEDRSIEEAMKLCLAGQALSYVIENRTIIVKPKQATDAQMRPEPVLNSITGTIRDTTGRFMPGVTVMNKTTGKGDASTENGQFTIDGNPGDILVFSFIGYASYQLTLGSSTHYDIVLREQPSALGEMVVTALGIKKSTKSLTYNIQEIKSEEVSTVPDASFVNSLNGKVAGVTINASASGIGGSTRVVMRGDKSVNGNNNALYVLDGIPLPNLFSASSTTPNGIYGGADAGDGIASINPEDIESVSVLTGASSAALYGGAAANGVILVNTKTGAKDRTKLSFVNHTAFFNPLILPKFQNVYGTTAPGSFDSWGAKLQAPSNYDPADFFETGHNVNNSIAVSTGTEKNQTYFSAAALRAGGILPNNDFDRYNLTLHNTTNYLEDRMKLDLNFMYVHSKSINGISQGQYRNPLVPLYLFPRGDDFEKYQVFDRYDAGRLFKTQYWPYGEQGMAMQNPYWTVHRNLNTYTKNRFIMGGSLNYKFTDWLQVTSRVRMDQTNGNQEFKYHASTLPLLSYNSLNGAYGNVNDHTTQTYADIIANFQKSVQSFGIQANLGASLLNSNYKNTGYAGGLAQIPNLFALNNVEAIGYTYPNDGQSTPFKDQSQSLFATLSFDYKSMIFLDMTGRNEWSSALANTSKNNFFYPSVGLSFILSDLLELPKSSVSYLKLRGSYSEVGNTIPRYITQLGYGVSPNGVNVIPNRPFQELKPERTKSMELGLNARFLQNRLFADVTVYQTNTFNQLFPFNPDAGSGVNIFYVNAGKIQNRGIEAAVGYDQRWGDFSWNATSTFTLNENKVLELVEDKISPISNKAITVNSFNMGGTDSYFSFVNKGGSIGDIYVNKLQTDHQGYIHVDNTGAVKVQPVSGTDPLSSLVYAGNSNPKYLLGFKNQFGYKNFQFGFLVSARVGGVVVSATQALLDGAGVSQTSADARDRGGVLVNGYNLNPKSFFQTIGSGTGVMSHYVYSATNVRLAEAHLSYKFGSLFKDRVKDLTLSVTGRNLFMFYNKAPFDPQNTASTGTYFQGIDYFMLPSLRSYGFSVRVNL